MVSRAGMMVFGADNGDVAAIMLNNVLSSWRAKENDVVIRE